MKYLYILLFCFLLNFASGQNIVFAYSVEATTATTRTLTFTASNTGAPETIQTGSWRLYYNSAKTTFTSGDPGPLGFGFSFNAVTGTNSAAVGADMYVDLNGFTFVPINIPDATPVPIFTMVFENVSPDPDPDNGTYFVNTIEDVVVAYSGSGGGGLPIVVAGDQQQSLPITLRSFNVKKVQDINVMLDWSSSSEINASHFEIERSQDGANWKYLGSVNAVGESTTNQDYSFLDNTLPLNTREDHKTFYYRLNMVDNDGAAEYSDIRSVRFDYDGDANFLVYPNPTVNEVYVNLSSISAETGPATLQITNMNGQLVKKVLLTTSDEISVDISNLNAGVYNFVAQQGEQSFVQRVIKID